MTEDLKPVFSFGKNWESFSKTLDQTRLDEACASLDTLIGKENLQGRTFLDIGCGSGLFSIAAAHLGATSVAGIDVDPDSVRTSISNAEAWLPNIPVLFKQASALRADDMAALGTYDVVYSWGVLHHTGNMQRAFELSAQCVKPGGLFVVAIYNRHITSGAWWLIKRVYNWLPEFGQKFLIWLFTPIIFIAKFLTTGKNPLKMKRGMDFMHNIIDWLGGFPYEYAGIAEMTIILNQLGFAVVKTIPAAVPTGCNEFVCRKK